MESKTPASQHSLSFKILIAMGLGFAFGMALRLLTNINWIDVYIINGILTLGGDLFITIMKMVVVPIVFVSLICGSTGLANPRKLGRIGAKTLGLYLFTTAIAITIGLTLATMLHIGHDSQHAAIEATYKVSKAPSLMETLANIVPANPLQAMVRGEMLQIIFFALVFGIAIANSGEPGQRLGSFFHDVNAALIKLIHIIMLLAPYGVFCLIAKLFAVQGFDLIISLLGYFFVVLLALLIHLLVVNTIMIRVFVGLNPLLFFRKMFSAMLFAFSTSSSNASLPVVLSTVRDKLGVDHSIASFTVPLGATINMDGTAIMQGVATVFIAHMFGIPITLTGYITIILMATLASIGTAGVPGVGLITLAMVLQQVGLPVEGIAVIIGVDRLLDMARTAVNITGDSAISCVVAKSEGSLNVDTFNDRSELDLDV